MEVQPWRYRCILRPNRKIHRIQENILRVGYDFLKPEKLKLAWRLKLKSLKLEIGKSVEARDDYCMKAKLPSKGEIMKMKVRGMQFWENYVLQALRSCSTNEQYIISRIEIANLHLFRDLYEGGSQHKFNVESKMIL